jgi:hypothetical protein
MGALGFELFDTTVTSSKGAMLVSSCVKVSKKNAFFCRINSRYTTHSSNNAMITDRTKNQISFYMNFLKF